MEIRHRYTGEIIATGEAPTLKVALEERVRQCKDLSGANLSGADLSGADLSGANLPPIPIVEQLDSKILAAIESGGNLEMAKWHTCETTHCRYGWAITLAGEAGKVLEGQVGPLTAGALIYWKSAGHIPPYMGNNDAVLEDIRNRAALETARK